MRGPAAGAPFRVGVVVDAGAVQIGSAGGIRVVGRGGGNFSVTAGNTIRVSARGGHVRVEGRGDDYSVLSLTGDRPISVDGTRYRGSIRITARSGAVTVVNVIGLEQYVAGVVGSEMGRRSAHDIEALKAQAVASRTYAMGNRGKWAARGFDLAGSVSDQAYGGVDSENDEVLSAVRSTQGEVLTYDGRLIDVFYHSTCGYATATPEEAFETVSSRPYLRSVSDRAGDGYYCDISPHFRWTVQWSGDQLQSILRRTLQQTIGIDPRDVGTVRALTAYTTGESGRVTELRIRVESGEIPVTGPRVRQVLEGPDGRPLGSNAVSFSSVNEGGQEVFTARGAGWGHGVGMCQWGAIGRARAGQSYRQILSHYLPGTRIEKRN